MDGQRVGRIMYYENGRLVWRAKHGVIDYYEYGELVRTEFEPTHSMHGEIHHYEKQVHVLTELVSLKRSRDTMQSADVKRARSEL